MLISKVETGKDVRMNMKEKFNHDLLLKKFLRILDRDRLGFKEVSKMMGMSPVTLNSFIDKTRKPTLRTLLKVYSFTERMKKKKPYGRK